MEKRTRSCERCGTDINDRYARARFCRPCAAPRPSLAKQNRDINQGGHRYEDAEWCRSRFVDQMMSYREMAAEAGCSFRTIARWVKIHGIAAGSAIERRELRGNTVRGERSPNWKGGPPRCACGNRMSVRSHKNSAKTCMSCRDYRGERHPLWRGDDIDYPAAHGRVKSQYGSATRHPCKHCGEQAAHWAYDHTDPDEKRGADGPYSVKIEHYMPLCVPCHKAFDLDYLRAQRQDDPE